jgi:hypothetical protein
MEEAWMSWSAAFAAAALIADMESFFAMSVSVVFALFVGPAVVVPVVGVHLGRLVVLAVESFGETSAGEP